MVAISSKEDKMKFKINYKMYIKEEILYKDNIIRAYATSFDYCRITMQQHIHELSNCIARS